jgi:hypothetical protein
MLHDNYPCSLTGCGRSSEVVQALQHFWFLLVSNEFNHSKFTC